MPVGSAKNLKITPKTLADWTDSVRHFDDEHAPTPDALPFLLSSSLRLGHRRCGRLDSCSEEYA